MSARCSRRWCGTVLEEVHDRELGRIAFRCRPCERNAAGRCRDCPAPLDAPNALRCRTCAKARARLTDLTRRKDRYRLDPEFREEMIQLKRAERRDPATRQRVLDRERKSRERRKAAGVAPARNHFDRLYQREWRRHHPTTPAQRERANARRRERYATDPVVREKRRLDNGRRVPLTAEKAQRRNARWRERYTTDAEFREKVLARVAKNGRARRRSRAQAVAA